MSRDITKVIENSWNERVEVSGEGALVALRIEAERTAYLNLTVEQADELGLALRAFATIMSSQESGR
jgi:hypothetical protein